MVHHQASLRASRRPRQQLQRELPHPSLQAWTQIKYGIERKEKATYLLCFRVRNGGVIDPVVRFAVFGIIDFLGGVDRRFEILKQVAFLFALSVNEHLKGIIGANAGQTSPLRLKKGKTADLIMRV